MTKKEYENIAEEIGEELANDGRAAPGLERWAKTYTWWIDCVEALGQEAAVAAAMRGYERQQAKNEAEEERE